jgi:hypothetical protein
VAACGFPLAPRLAPTTSNYDSIINYLKITDGTNITINNNNIIVHNITDVYDKIINNTWYMFSSNVFYICEQSEHREHSEQYYIYIEKPPSYGIINTNIIYVNNSFINIQYTILEDREDNMIVRILNKDKTKISDSIVITIKNYTVNRITSLSSQLVNDNYYIDNRCARLTS